VNNAAIEQRIQGLNFILDRFGPVPDININGFSAIGPQQWQNGGIGRNSSLRELLIGVELYGSDGTTLGSLNMPES
jgi:hypothetical protein